MNYSFEEAPNWEHTFFYLKFQICAVFKKGMYIDFLVLKFQFHFFSKSLRFFKNNVFTALDYHESESHSVGRTLCDPILYSPWDFPGQNTAVGSFSLLQGVFPTQGSNPGLPHCRQILYQKSYQGICFALDYHNAKQIFTQCDK